MEKTQPKYQNSAGRLLAILTAMAASPSEQSYIEAIPKFFFGANLRSYLPQRACMIGLWEIHKLYTEFTLDMLDKKISEQQRRVIFSGLEGIQHSIYPLAINSGYRALTDTERSLLEVAATIIPEEESLNKSDIEKIQESIASLRNLVDDSDIPRSIRKVLLDLIRISEDAIARYNIHGSRGLRKAFKEMLAEVITSSEGEREELKKSGAWVAIVKYLKIFDEISSRLIKYKPVIESISQILLGAPRP